MTIYLKKIDDQKDKPVLFSISLFSSGCMKSCWMSSRAARARNGFREPWVLRDGRTDRLCSATAELKLTHTQRERKKLNQYELPNTEKSLTDMHVETDRQILVYIGVFVWQRALRSGSVSPPVVGHAGTEQGSAGITSLSVSEPIIWLSCTSVALMICVSVKMSLGESSSSQLAWINGKN